MKKQHSKEERNGLIAECKDWMANGKSVSSFAKVKGIPSGTVYCWMSGKKSSKNPSNTPLVHIPKIQRIKSTTSLLVEMRCGSLSFVFNDGYSKESIEATLVSLKKCGLL